ncbi:MAG TPA: cytochrome c maturation protein CcmE [Terriglobales bacterium]|nr:cytochrome c maturation protein CcmE [Terriglobales bacterium]
MRVRLPRLRTLVLGGAIAGSLGWVAGSGLTGGSLVYYETPGDLLAHSSGRDRVRLGGLVEPGSVQEVPGGVHFVVTDGTHQMPVFQQGGVPSMFQAGRGVVVEGVYGADGVFHGDTVMVKHDNVYRPPAPGEQPPRSAQLG